MRCYLQFWRKLVFWVSRTGPGDVTLPLWANGKGLAMDIAVVCPLAQSHLDEVEPAECYAVAQKHSKYDEAFIRSGYDFAAIVFETSGGVNLEGEQILKQIFRFASRRSMTSHSRFCSRAWTRLSCCIQRASCQMLISRVYAEFELRASGVLGDADFL